MRSFGLLCLLCVWVSTAAARLPALELFDQDPAAAVSLLQQAIAEQPLLSAALRLRLAQAQLVAEDLSGAWESAQLLLAQEGPWAPSAAWIALRALPKTACAQVAALGERAAAATDEPQRLAQIAALEGRCGRPAAQREALHTLALQWPASPQGQEAFAQLTLDADQHKQRLEGLRAVGAWPLLAEGLDHVERAGLVEAPWIAQMRARWAYESRRAPEEAARWYTERAQEAQQSADAAAQAEALYGAARAWGRAGQHVEAAQAWGALAALPEAARDHAQARFFEAFAHYERGDWARAAQGFEALAQASEVAARWVALARWYHAMCLLLLEDPQAEGAFRAYAASTTDRAERRKARYWAMRLASARAPAEAAVQAVQLVAEAPLDWYSLLIQAEHPSVFSADPWAQTPALAQRPAEADWPEALRPRVALIRAHHEAGLEAEARQLLEAETPQLNTAQTTAAYVQLALSVGAPHRALRSAMRAGAREALAPPTRQLEAEAVVIQSAAWPVAYTDLVRGAASRHSVSAQWLWAFIRKESAFDARARSHAHAEGLMQLLPRTAQKLVSRGQVQRAHLRLVGEAPDLMDPATNIELGAAYLAGLSARFSGQLPLVAAAYNAGPAPVIQWLGAAQGAQIRTDLFIETIPFKETREYVKRLYTGLVRVQVLHGALSLEESLRGLPVTLDAQVAPGLDF